MNAEVDHEYFRCDMVNETLKAVHVVLWHNGQSYWVPRSVCEIKNSGTGRVLEIETWFAKKEGMHG